jgi:hypothetical protein
VGVREGVGGVEAEGEALRLAGGEGEGVAARGVAVPNPAGERVGGGLAGGESDAEPLEEALPVCADDPERAGGAVVAAARDGGGEALSEGGALAEGLALALRLRGPLRVANALREGEALARGLREGGGEAVAAPLPEPKPLLEGDTVAAPLPEQLPLLEGDPVCEALPFCGVAEEAPEGDAPPPPPPPPRGEGVPPPGGLPLAVATAGEPLPSGECVRAREGAPLPLPPALPLPAGEPLPLPLRAPLRLTEGEGESLPLLAPAGEGDARALREGSRCEGDTEPVALGEREGRGEALPDAEPEGVPEARADSDGSGDGEAVLAGEPLPPGGEGVGGALPVAPLPLREGTAPVAEAVPLREGSLLRVGGGEALPAREALPPLSGEREAPPPLLDACALPVAPPLSVAPGGDGVAERERLGVGGGEGE